MEDEVDRLGDREVLCQVVAHEDEVVAADVLDVLERPRIEVVDAEHPVARGQQMVAEMRADEARAAGHESGGHVHNLVPPPEGGDLEALSPLATAKKQAPRPARGTI